MKNIEQIKINKELVLQKEEQIASTSNEIRSLFSAKTDAIQAAAGVITKEVEGIEHTINRLFDAKSKIEAEVKVLKNDILKLVLE